MTIVFLCGVDMNPLTIRSRAELVGTRFTGIGSIEASAFPEFPTEFDRIWGIVLEDAGQSEGVAVTIQRRDGTPVHGQLISGADDVSDIGTVVSEARYWELPVNWWQSLKRT